MVVGQVPTVRPSGRISNAGDDRALTGGGKAAPLVECEGFLVVVRAAGSDAQELSQVGMGEGVGLEQRPVGTFVRAGEASIHDNRH